MTAAPGAVVLGGDYQGLGIVRSLGRAGVPVLVVDQEHSIAKHSRYATRSARVAHIGDPDRTPDILVRLAEEFDVADWVLFPTLDETVALIAQNHDRLSGVFRLATPSWEQIQWAWDKRNTYRLAEELGIPYPRTWYPSTLADLEEIDCSRPLVLKPAIKEHFIYATKAKAWRADTRDQLVQRFREAQRIVGDGEIIIQELIPGGGAQLLGYCAFVRDGVPVATMASRRWRQHPPEFGRASTYVETIEDAAAEELSERLLGHLRYTGLIELEYKIDPDTGARKLLDFNARTWGYHTLGMAAGCDFPLIQYHHAVGLDVEPRRAAVGVRWIRLLTDTPTAFVELVNRRLTVRGYLSSLRRADTEAVFSREDPLPGIVECVLAPYLIATRGF